MRRNREPACEKEKRIKGRTWLLLSVGLLLIIHILFRIPASFYWLEHVWEAGDLITFIGTIVLGYVAYWQTTNANETNDRLLKIEEARYKLELRPFVMVADYSAYVMNNMDIIKNPEKAYIMVGKPENDNDDVLCIEFSLMNTTNSYVSAKYDDATFSGRTSKWIHCVVNQKDYTIRLQPCESKPLVLYAPPADFQELLAKKIRFRLILENRIGERYAEYFNVLITALDGNLYGYSITGNWYVSMSIQDYQVNRLENVTTDLHADMARSEIEICEDSENKLSI